MKQISKTEVRTEKETKDRLVDRLDIQLLITVILFFVSAWVYLNNIICEFTGSELYSEQMSYVFVHYLLTAILLFSIGLTAIKSFYILIDDDINPKLLKLFSLFLDSWFWLLLFSVLIILCSNFFDSVWLFGAIMTCIFVCFKMTDLDFRKQDIVVAVVAFVGGFYLFIPTMTSLQCTVEIETDKPFYSFSEKVLITVNARGYACKHKLVGLGEQYVGAKYYSEKGLIILNATQIKNNEIAVATVSPSTGFANFVTYPFLKMFNRPFSYIDIDENNIDEVKRYAHFTPKSIYVKP